MTMESGGEEVKKKIWGKALMFAFWVLMGGLQSPVGGYKKRASSTSSAVPSESIAGIVPSTPIPLSLDYVPSDCPGNFVHEQTEGPYYKVGSPERANLIKNMLLVSL